MSSEAAPGMLIDYRDGDSVTAGVVLGEEKGRFLVVTEKGREERIAPSRVALVVGRVVSGTRPIVPSEAAKNAGDHARRAALAAGGVEIETLWELLVDEGAGRSLGELAALALGREDGESLAAALRALLAERVWFQRKDEVWVPRSREAVFEMLRQREREKERAAARERFIGRCRARLAGNPFEETWSEAEEGIWRSVEALAVDGPGAPAAKGAAATLSEIGFAFHSEEEGAFRVGLALGRFEADENLLLRRFALRTEFSREVLDAAGIAAGHLHEVLSGEAASNRLDLRSEDAFTVDDADTMELDDALSVRVEPDGNTRVGIHIADPSAFMDPGGALDAEAEARVTTHYLPDRRIPMIPPALSEGAASLVAGEDRPALSFLVRFAPSGERLSSEIALSIVRTRRRLSYDEATEAIAQETEETGSGTVSLYETVPDPVSVLWRIAQALEEERMAAGAVRIAAPEVEARPRPDGTIVLQRIEPDRPGRRLVAEMMILANSLAAAQCIKGHIPAPYRKQAPPDEPVGSLPTDSYDPVAVRRARRAMKRGEVSATPGPHAGLGLRAYLQATSPLRRYQDLVVHRQIAAHLAGRPLPYDQDAVARIAATTEEAERQARLLERARRDYWLLRWLEERTGKTAEAVVIETNARRTDIELSETLLGASIPARADHAPGQRLLLRIERVIPRASFIALREI